MYSTTSGWLETYLSGKDMSAVSLPAGPSSGVVPKLNEGEVEPWNSIPQDVRDRVIAKMVTYKSKPRVALILALRHVLKDFPVDVSGSADMLVDLLYWSTVPAWVRASPGSVFVWNRLPQSVRDAVEWTLQGYDGAHSSDFVVAIYTVRNNLVKNGKIIGAISGESVESALLTLEMTVNAIRAGQEG